MLWLWKWQRLNDIAYITRNRLRSLDLLGLEALEGGDRLVGCDSDHLLAVLGIGLPLEDDTNASWWVATAAEPDPGVELLIDLDNFGAHQTLTSLDDLLDRALGLVLTARIVHELLDVNRGLDLRGLLRLVSEPGHDKGQAQPP